MAAVLSTGRIVVSCTEPWRNWVEEPMPDIEIVPS